MGQKKVIKTWIMLVALSTAAWAQSAPAWAATEATENGKINYSQRVITATGIGAVPANAPNVGAARANAIRAAQLDALRNLVEVVKGVRVNSETTIENSMVSSDVIRTSVEGMVRGATRVGDVKYLSDSSVEVTMQVPMSGIMDVMLPQAAEGVDPTSIDMATAKVDEAAAAAAAADAVTPAASGPITGLIIDARGLGLKPSMSPRIVDQNGDILYGPGKYSREFAINQGVVGYHKDPLAAQSDTRVAGNPLTVKGVGTGGNLATDVIISSSAAQKAAMLEGFAEALSNCRVMFILD